MTISREDFRQQLKDTFKKGLYLAVPWLARIQSLDPKDIGIAGDPPLCTACVRIFKSRRPQKVKVLSISFARLKASVELGCYICGVLYNAVWTCQSSRPVEAPPPQRLRDISSEPNGIAYWIDIADEDEQPGCFEIYFAAANDKHAEDVWQMKLILVPETGTKNQ
jgi:hypothetical protein